MNFIGTYNFKSSSALIKLYSSARKTHYDILNLHKNCTNKEIKNAFIQLSKEYHPDKSKDVKAQEKFVQIVDAYNVLSKPSSRFQYDNMIAMQTHAGSQFVYRSHTPYEDLRNNTQYHYENLYANRSKRRDDKKDSYYGIMGIKKLPNYIIISMCFGIATVGVLLQLLVIRKSFVTHRQQAEEKTKFLAEELDRVRAVANENGNEMQARILLEKIVSSSNPAVATASLGQALAGDKK